MKLKFCEQIVAVKQLDQNGVQGNQEFIVEVLMLSLLHHFNLFVWFVWSPKIFNLVSGNTSRSWEKLDVGSTVSHSFVLESNVKGVYHAAPAVIKFRTPTKASLQEAFSSPILPLEILVDRPPEIKFQWV
ncbi:hypothetical protein MKW94_008727, partial [Papaver nudicaule]|nr:hypothetical protein [Papaver nudicaule]